MATRQRPLTRVSGTGGTISDWGSARQKSAVVVMPSRVGAGRVILTTPNRKRGFIAADNPSPQKARILLMLVLTVTEDERRIQEMLDTY